MGQEKNHKNAVDFHKNILESKFNYRCRKEFNLPRNGQIKQLDCACFHKSPSFPSIGMEFESGTNWNNPQIMSNQNDLLEFKKIFPNSKVFHKHISETINFDEELKVANRPSVQNQNNFRKLGGYRR